MACTNRCLWLAILLCLPLLFLAFYLGARTAPPKTYLEVHQPWLPPSRTIQWKLTTFSSGVKTGSGSLTWNPTQKLLQLNYADSTGVSVRFLSQGKQWRDDLPYLVHRRLSTPHGEFQSGEIALRKSLRASATLTQGTSRAVVALIMEPKVKLIGVSGGFHLYTSREGEIVFLAKEGRLIAFLYGEHLTRLTASSATMSAHDMSTAPTCHQI